MLTASRQWLLGSGQKLHCRGQVAAVLLIPARDFLQYQAAHSSSKAEAVCSSLVSVYTASNEHAACQLVDKGKKNVQLLCSIIVRVMVNQASLMPSRGW